MQRQTSPAPNTAQGRRSPGERRGLPLRSYLILYGLLMVLPVLAFGAWVINHYSRAERAATEERARWYAHDLSKNIEHELRRAVDQLNTLVSSRALASGDMESLHRRMKHAADIFKGNMIVRDANGQQLLNTRVPWGSLLPRSNFPAESNASLLRDRLHISNLFEGAVKKQPIFTVTVPILQDDRLTHSISMSFDPDALLTKLDIPLPPKGWIAHVADRQGRIIAATERHAEVFGTVDKPLPSAHQVRSGSSLLWGVDEIEATDGTQMLRGYHRAARSGWVVTVMIPTDELRRHFKQRWQGLAAAGTTLMLLSIALASLLATGLVRQFRLVSVQAAALASDAQPMPQRRALLREANEVIGSLQTAHAELGSRSRALNDRAALLRAVFEGSPVGMFRADLDKNCTYANTKLCQLSNVEMHELLGLGWTRAIPDDVRIRLLSEWDTAIREQRPFVFEFEVLSVARGLGQMHAHLHAVPELDADGRFVGYIGAVSDITERKKSEAALVAEHDRFRRMLQATPDLVYVRDVENGQVEFLNGGPYRLRGYELTQGSTSDLATFDLTVHPDDIPQLLAARQRVQTANDGTVAQSVVRVRGPATDAPQLWLHMRTVAFSRDRDGNVRQVLGVITEITDRKHAEMQMADERDRFRRMLQATPDLVYLHEVGSQEMDFLDRGPWDLLGLADSEHQKLDVRQLEELTHPDDRQAAAEHRARVRTSKDGEVNSLEVRMFSLVKGAPLVWLLIRTVVFSRHPDGRVHQVLGVVSNITARKLAEAQLADEIAKFRRMTLASPDLIFTYDRQAKRVTYLNRSLHEVLGYPVDGAVTQGEQAMYQYIFPEDVDAAHAHIKSFRNARNGEVLQQESRFKGPDGTTRWLSNRSVVLSRHPDGRAHLVLGVTTDVTQRNIAAAAIARSHAELETRVDVEVARREEVQREVTRAQNLEAIGRLTGGVAHDFNNVLTIIMASLQLFKKRYGDKAPMTFIDDALDGATTGHRLTQQLLSFAKRQSLDPVAIRLGEHLEGIVRWMRTTLGAGIEVRASIPADLGTILVDETALDSAVINLMMNAQDAMGETGVLFLDAGNITLADRADEHSGPGEYVYLAISDTGAGMEPEIARRIFEPFYTTKNDRLGGGGGTGLGLSSVYGFVKQSHGRIEVRSRTGQGSCFILYLPRATGEIDWPADAQGTEGLAPEGRGETVLIVEDMPKVRKLLRQMVESLGYATLEAETGAAAKDIIARTQAAGAPLDLVMSDVLMPGGVSGPDLARWMENAAPRLPVLLMSAYDDGAHGTDDESSRCSFRLPMRIGKPFTRSQIATALRDAMDKQPAGAAGSDDGATATQELAAAK